ncbi:MAG: FAD-dependent oxidoreductase [Candidatus Melainabacteria bacterium]|nr:FAD-dependent oxidoreductase [Candidatus Melainabacteria bacterium]
MTSDRISSGNRLSPSVAVVGAGVAGLVCAGMLKKAGCRVVVFDKGRFPGGRLASRSRDENCFDYGAQYFTAKTSKFKEFLEPYLHAGEVAKWDGRFAHVADGSLIGETEQKPRYVGVPLMRSIADSLSSAVECKLSHRVLELSRASSGKWSIVGRAESVVPPQDFTSGEFDFVVLNMPPAQANQLHPLPAIEEVVLRPCLALLLSFNVRVDFNWDGVVLNDELISWIARDSSKPGRPAGERWVVHASPDWSEENFQADENVIKKVMTDRFATIVRVNLSSVTFAKLHKWKFALPLSPVGPECIYDAKAAIVYCGDWCVGARVEGAYLSGVAAAEKIICTLSA